MEKRTFEVYSRPSILKRMEERKRPIKNIFEEPMEEIDQNVKPTTGETEAVKLGIQHEEKGLKPYADLSNAASHWLEKKFYIQLGNEERGHMLILRTSRPTTMIRFTGSQLRRGRIGTGIKKALPEKGKGSRTKKRGLIIELSRSLCGPSP